MENEVDFTAQSKLGNTVTLYNCKLFKLYARLDEMTIKT